MDSVIVRRVIILFRFSKTILLLLIIIILIAIRFITITAPPATLGSVFVLRSFFSSWVVPQQRPVTESRNGRNDYLVADTIDPGLIQIVCCLD